MTISICRTVECKGEKVLENTFKTLKLGWSFSKYLSGHKNVFTRRLFFFFPPLPVSPTRKTCMEVKSKLASSCQPILGWFSIPAARQSQQGALPTAEDKCHSPSGAGRILKQPHSNPLTALEGTHPYSLVTWFPCWGLCQLRSWSFCLNESLNQLIQILPNRPSG